MGDTADLVLSPVVSQPESYIDFHVVAVKSPESPS